MVAQELEVETLGQKHRGYNTTLKELIVSSTTPDKNFDDTDINHLLKIDIASHNKDVNYILEVLKSNDMLCVSRALSQAKWLITDQEYANIINPEYLQSNLYPYMITKAICKVKKHIRHNIKDETRAEQFYNSEKQDCDAIKWLPYCSVEFIESKIEHHVKSSSNSFDLRMFKRLAEKSFSIFSAMIKNVYHYDKPRYLQFVTFLLDSDIDKFLDIIEEHEYNLGYGGQLSHNKTELIMKRSPDRVINNIDKYVNLIHLPTFIQHLPAEKIKAFLHKQANRDLGNFELQHLKILFRFDTLKLFIKRLPKNEQLDFVKQICLGEDIEEVDKEVLSTDTEIVRIQKVCNQVNRNSYVWYEFASFELAFEEITKLYPLTLNKNAKRNMLLALIKFANHNLKYIQQILKFYNDHTKEDSCGKFQIVINVLENTHVATYDEATWNALNELLIATNIYEQENVSDNYPTVVNSIIVYSILNDQKIPEVIEKQFKFDTLTAFASKMNEEQRNKIFGFLYDYLLSKMKEPVVNESDLNESIQTLENVLKLLQDWEKSFLDFPLILNKIREFIKLKKENSWKVSLSSLYNVNKSWRKHMFEESVTLCPNEEVCLNALKHDPQLLKRHSDEVDALKTSDNVSLRRLHSKLRVYWLDSLAQQWIDTYMNNIVTTTTGQKAAIQGLCMLLDQKQLFDIIEKYKPVNAKIDWKQIEERELNIQRLLAKNMHLARPQPIPDAILSYAKGDYLQFALPSLLAIFYNLSMPMNKQYISKLLDAPVSIQKHGIRHAFKKLDREDLKKIFLDCWKTSKNISIRAIIFKYTFTLLCSEKDDEKIINLWELLELFMDNLTFAEDKDTYKLLAEVEKVPLVVRPKFLVKSYEFLQKLIPKVDESNRSTYQWFCAQLAEHSRQLIETISPEFVLSIIQTFIDNDFLKDELKFIRSVHYSDGIISVISAYLLSAPNENDQLQRYEQIIAPLMQRSFEKWGIKRDGHFVIRKHFQQLLTRLSMDLKDYVAENKKIIPVKMFSLMQTEMEKSLKVSENYLMLTKWKLTVTLAKLAEQYSATEDKIWYDDCGVEFGQICLDYLKQDVSAHFPCIYVLFSRSVKSIMQDILPKHTILKFYDSILSDSEFIQAYLAAIEMSSHSRNCDYHEIHDKIFAHPSVEVKMHYYNKIETPKI